MTTTQNIARDILAGDLLAAARGIKNPSFAAVCDALNRDDQFFSDNAMSVFFGLCIAGHWPGSKCTHKRF